tara:strand:+ start:18200 stop:18646 length:447 start_codon:yes stop_codon:yes gene_type:complete
MSLGKHLEGCTVDEKGRSLKDLHDLLQASNLHYDNMSHIDLDYTEQFNKCMKYEKKLLLLMAKILDDNGVCRDDNDFETKVWYRTLFAEYCNVLTFYMIYNSTRYKFDYWGKNEDKRVFANPRHSRDKKAYDTLLDYLPKEISHYLQN